MSTTGQSAHDGPSFDLRRIITHVARAEMATDEVTIAFLDAGESLLRRYFLSAAPDAEAAEALYARILPWVSRPAVSKEARRRSDAWGEKPRRAPFVTAGTSRCTTYAICSPT